MHHPLSLSPDAHGQPLSTSSGAGGSSFSSSQPHTHTETHLDPVSPHDRGTPAADVVFTDGVQVY